MAGIADVGCLNMAARFVVTGCALADGFVVIDLAGLYSPAATSQGEMAGLT